MNSKREKLETETSRRNLIRTAGLLATGGTAALAGCSGGGETGESDQGSGGDNIYGDGNFRITGGVNEYKSGMEYTGEIENVSDTPHSDVFITVDLVNEDGSTQGSWNSSGHDLEPGETEELYIDIIMNQIENYDQVTGSEINQVIYD